MEEPRGFRSIKAAADRAAEIVALAMRAGPEIASELSERFEVRLDELPTEGLD